MAYIDREAIMRQFADRVRRSNNSDFESTPTWNQAVQIVEDFPSADDAPVKRGKWVEQHSDFDLCGVVYYECSECKREQQVKWHFCPNCGAKMEEDE